MAGTRGYLAFIITLGALFTASGGIHLKGDIAATPRNNLLFLLVGALLASLIGTTGASMLLIRPLLKTNRQRQHRMHLVPFFILIVANAGGLLPIFRVRLQRHVARALDRDCRAVLARSLS